MATYSELFGLRMNDSLRQRVGVACLVAADKIAVEPGNTPNHAVRLEWARQVQRDPPKTAQQMWNAVLAQNKALTPTAITGATDDQLQAWVDAAVNLCAYAYGPVASPYVGAAEASAE